MLPPSPRPVIPTINRPNRVDLFQCILEGCLILRGFGLVECTEVDDPLPPVTPCNVGCVHPTLQYVSIRFPMRVRFGHPVQRNRLVHVEWPDQRGTEITSSLILRKFFRRSRVG